MDETQATNSVRVKIYNQEYALCTDGDPEYLKELCAVLNERMYDIVSETGVVDTLKVAVLSALSFADDARRAKEETRKLDEAIVKRSTACATIIENSLL